MHLTLKVKINQPSSEEVPLSVISPSEYCKKDSNHVQLSEYVYQMESFICYATFTLFEYESLSAPSSHCQSLLNQNQSKIISVLDIVWLCFMDELMNMYYFFEVPKEVPKKTLFQNAFSCLMGWCQIDSAHLILCIYYTFT